MTLDKNTRITFRGFSGVVRSGTIIEVNKDDRDYGVTYVVKSASGEISTITSNQIQSVEG